MSQSKFLNRTIYIITYLVIIGGFLFDFSKNNEIIDWVCILLLMTLGIIHGSNDLYLQSKSNRMSNFKLTNRILCYLLLIAVLIIIFVIQPALALVSFISYSAFHFGEQQLSFLKLKNNFLSFALYTSLGALVLITIFLIDYDQVQSIFDYFQLYIFNKDTFEVIRAILLVLISMYVFALFSLNSINLKKVVEIYFQIATLYLLFYRTNLLLAFTLYFILWHSLPSIDHQIRTLRKRVLNYNLWMYIKNSSIIYIVSLFGIILITAFAKDSVLLIKILIIISASVTLPHILTISQFNRSK